MLFRQIALAAVFLSFSLPAFANHCPPADKVRSCSGSSCAFQRLAGWSETIFFTDVASKAFSFQKEFVDGREISCYYSYVNPDTNRLSPPALLLKTMIR